MAVAAQQGLAGGGEALTLEKVADPVAVFGKDRPVMLRSCLQKTVVVGALGVCFHSLMVGIDAHLFHSQAFRANRIQKLRHQDPGQILGQRLVDTQQDGAAAF